jgi:hypothetical protein
MAKLVCRGEALHAKRPSSAQDDTRNAFFADEGAEERLSLEKVGLGTRDADQFDEGLLAAFFVDMGGNGGRKGLEAHGGSDFVASGEVGRRKCDHIPAASTAYR